jgi:RNAse (barnase) inhibitor barstar
MSLYVARILADPLLNGIYRLERPSDLLPTLDGRSLDGKDGLLSAIGWALEFPEYYGANWDALEECLSDMTWREGPIALHLQHADALDEALLHTLMEIYADVAADWGGKGRACSLFLSGLKDPDLPLAG